MVKTKDGDGGIHSSILVCEVEKRPCLYDSNHPNYGDRNEKFRCWEEVSQRVVPGWFALGLPERLAAAKEVQKRWRSIRDSYTKAYRQGKCVLPEQCAVGSRRYQYHKQMSFLLIALQNKKSKYAPDKYESFSELSTSPLHQNIEEIQPKVKHEIIDFKVQHDVTDKPLDLKKKPNKAHVILERQKQTDEGKTKNTPVPEKYEKSVQTEADDKSAIAHLENKTVASGIHPDDHFDDDKMFMYSLVPLFKKMDDDSRLLCRIEMLKIVRLALQGNKCFEELRLAEDSFFKNRISGILMKREVIDTPKQNESTLSMTTRSADGSRPLRKRQSESSSATPTPVKKRGPGRPRKVRPPSDTEDEYSSASKKCSPKLKVSPVVVPKMSELDESISKATSVANLTAPQFMKVYNLERTKPCESTTSVKVKTEPVDVDPSGPC